MRGKTVNLRFLVFKVHNKISNYDKSGSLGLYFILILMIKKTL